MANIPRLADLKQEETFYRPGQLPETTEAAENEVDWCTSWRYLESLKLSPHGRGTAEGRKAELNGGRRAL